MRSYIWSAVVAVMLLPCHRASACIWDNKTLWEEKHENPTLAEAILHPKAYQPDIPALTDELKKLKDSPQTNDPAWWNNVAGTYLRLGQPLEAVNILEPLTNRFADDYGIHANLGTAYHLLGRYVEAEREIRRDTEINTNAHFGLEKYHLALLQYLVRDKDYQLLHVYVDEYTKNLVIPEVPNFIEPEDRLYEYYKSENIKREEATAKVRAFFAKGDVLSHADFLLRIVLNDEKPAYRSKWTLNTDPKLEEGVIYMATLNPKEPACWVMLGVIAAVDFDHKLAKTAWKRAIELGSPQAPLLKAQMAWEIKSTNWNEESYPEIFRRYLIYLVPPVILLLLARYWFKRNFKRRTVKK